MYARKTVTADVMKQCMRCKRLSQRFPPKEAMAWFFTNYLYDNPNKNESLAWSHFIRDVKRSQQECRGLQIQANYEESAVCNTNHSVRVD